MNDSTDPKPDSTELEEAAMPGSDADPICPRCVDTAGGSADHADESEAGSEKECSEASAELDADVEAAELDADAEAEEEDEDDEDAACGEAGSRVESDEELDEEFSLADDAEADDTSDDDIDTDDFDPDDEADMHYRRVEHLPFLPDVWSPLEGDLAQEMKCNTDACPPWHTLTVLSANQSHLVDPDPPAAGAGPSTQAAASPQLPVGAAAASPQLPVGADAADGAQPAVHASPMDVSQPHSDPATSSPTSSKLASSCPGAGAGQSGQPCFSSQWRLQVDLEAAKWERTAMCWHGTTWTGAPRRGIREGRVRGVNTATLVQNRELGGAFSSSTKRHITASRHLPFTPHHMVDFLPSRAYIGQFTQEGDKFVAAFQHKHVRIYDVDNDWKLIKDVEARLIRWTVTDTSMSPDGRLLVYSSITPVVHIVNVASTLGFVESIANITDVHEPLHFMGNSQGNAEDNARHRFGIWSIKWSDDGERMIAGTSDPSLVLFDVETRKPTSTVQAHDDDVNAVTWLDGVNVICTGSDDWHIKVWDRRMMGNGRRQRPVGLFVGHTEGITHMNARGDGRHLISNSKDQSIKLWDLRKVTSYAEHSSRPMPALPNMRWDYRWQDYPARGRLVRHPYDCSLMTYRGHSVQATLIRAYFSPMATTGQRYIYTGSYDGSVHVYDVLTGRMVQTLRHHKIVVRDCSWHPYEPKLATVSWDGSLVTWGDAGGAQERPQSAGSDKFEGFY